MEFSVENKTARLSVGELADFQIGPRESGEGAQGLWRAQLGTHWHNELRTQLTSEQPTALFEIPITAEVVHRGWRISLSGRIDQLVPPNLTSEPRPNEPRPAAKLREVKTVTRALPAAEEELRAEYPSYFAQLATYLALSRLIAPIHPALDATTPVHGELVFVEVGSGLTQAIPVTAADEQGFQVQLERLTEFLDARQRARERLRALNFRSAFTTLRPGQESIQDDLRKALGEHPIVMLEAPTGFGKTGALLECALHQLRSGRFERVLYLTSKATGQLQVVHQLRGMTSSDFRPANSGAGAAAVSASAAQSGIAVWHVRNKREHCINDTFQCVRDVCRHLHDVETRWARSGLSRFYLFENEPRTIEDLRLAGSAAGICPYEITRTSLAFNDVWIGDYNYVFAPGSRGLFYDQPGFDPARTLLIVDEAHNLPTRVADAYSQGFNAADACFVGENLARLRSFAPLSLAWDHWTHFLTQLKPSDALSPDQEDDARHLLEQIAKQLGVVPPDYVELGPQATELIWQIPSFLNYLETDLPRLWWTPRAGELLVTCLDAAAVIGPALRSFGSAILATATLGPPNLFVEACGLETAKPERRPVETPTARLGGLNKRDTKKLFKHLSSGADLLELREARDAAEPAVVRAATPWREGAYNVGIDLRVDTSYQQRMRSLPVTARTIEAFSESWQRVDRPKLHPDLTNCITVFFPSYSYAEAVQRQMAESGSVVRVALQPRLPDLAAQRAWAEETLALADAMFLVLGSSFAEGVDFLGGKIGGAIVVGPALPEVNAVQRARLAALSGTHSREAAFRRVYQVPGIQKVNQALGRLVRAPGQSGRVLLHCRRFAETAYASLLAPEYQFGENIATDEDLQNWLAR
ncbi:MAG TPA: helicase C-terminal domain-containing protein [Opitutaceae bacterium]|nr:helicase C-terminal domain-containing protein [Opitutaceae bacterium]